MARLSKQSMLLLSAALLFQLALAPVALCSEQTPAVAEQLVHEIDQAEPEVDFDRPQAVLLDSVSETHRFVQMKLQEFRRLRERGEEIDSVQITYIGNEEPPQIQALQLALRDEVQITTTVLRPEQMDLFLEQHNEAMEKLSPELRALVAFDPSADGSDLRLPPNETTIRRRVKGLGLAMKNWLGITKYTAWMTYVKKKVKLSTEARGKVMKATLLRATIGTVAMHFSLKTLIATGVDVNYWAPMALNAAWEFFWAYFQVPTSRYKAQGVKYDVKEGKYKTKKSFQMLSSLAHSLAVRLTLKTAMFLTPSVLTSFSGASWMDRGEMAKAGFTMLGAAALTSLKGFAAKAPLEAHIENKRREKWHAMGAEGERLYTGSLTRLGIAMSVLQITDLVGVGTPFRVALWAGAIYGFAHEAYQERAAYITTFKRLWRRMTGQKLRQRCEALLVFHAKRPGSASSSEIE